MQNILKFFKEHKYFLLVIFLVNIVFLFYIYKDSTIQGHDLLFHVANIQNLLHNGLHIQAIMPGLAHNLGYGLYIFYPFFPHFCYGIVASLFSLFSVPVIHSLLFSNIVVAIFSSFVMYILSYRLFHNKYIALLSACIYALFPYRLGTVTVRMAINENFAGIFIPLILFSLTYLLGENVRSKRFLFFFIVGYAGLIFSHYVLAFYFTFFVFFILLFYLDKFTKKEVRVLFFKAVGIVSILVLPNIILFLEHYGGEYLVYLDNYITSFGLIQDNILSLKDLIVPTRNYDWTIPFYISFPVLLAFLYSTYLSVKKSNTVCMILALLSVCTGCFLMFEFLWSIFPSLFYNIQFPWRLLLILAVFVSLLAPWCLKDVSKNWCVFAIIILILFSIPLVDKLSRRIYHYDYTNVEMDAALGNLKEYYPYGYLDNVDYYEKKEGIDVLEGSGQITILSNDIVSNQLVFSVNQTEGVSVEFPRIYYKGYRLTNQEGHSISIEKNSAGFVVADLQNGEYKLTYHDTTFVLIFRVLRLLFILGSGCCFCFKMIQKHLF